MASYRNEKTKIFIYGYVRRIKGRYIPKDIIDIIYGFHGQIYYHFNVYDSKGTMIHENGKEMYSNYDTLFIVNNDDSLTVKSSEMNTFKIIYKFFNNISIDLISQGRWNSHAFVYTLEGNLYGFGENSRHELGIDGNDPVIPPTLVCFKFDSSIKQISCGLYHTLFLTNNGNIFGCGLNDEYQLTSKYGDNGLRDIQPIMNTGNITQIGCCYQTSFALDSNNILQSFGYDIRKSENAVTKGNKTLSNSCIIFDCGVHHLGYITKSNEIYMLGYNGDWQCGIKSPPDRCQFNKINLNRSFDNIRLGGYHTIIKTKSNEYYSFGWNYYDQLLIPQSNNIKNTKCLPQLISHKYISKLTKYSGKIIDIIPIRSFTYILIESN